MLSPPPPFRFSASFFSQILASPFYCSSFFWNLRLLFSSPRDQISSQWRSAHPVPPPPSSSLVKDPATIRPSFLDLLRSDATLAAKCQVPTETDGPIRSLRFTFCKAQPCNSKSADPTVQIHQVPRLRPRFVTCQIIGSWSGYPTRNRWAPPEDLWVHETG